uniref:Uncharacterized protein n=1 Tax=Nymphaea colorata TaxID=210225 RepID=A0A5K1HQS3_9MAGN|nr:unnamed protein product [Nymphaea colorata]
MRHLNGVVVCGGGVSAGVSEWWIPSGPGKFPLYASQVSEYDRDPCPRRLEGIPSCHFITLDVPGM